MKQYGLIGFPLSHSFSKKYFTDKFEREGIRDCAYEAYPIAGIELLSPLLLSDPFLRGLNVTIPYKEKVIPYLDYQNDIVAATGACNCIKIIDGKLHGYNTDAIGFELSLKTNLQPQHHKALILGTGGAAKAVAFILKKLQIEFLYVSRGGKTMDDRHIQYDAVTDDILLSHPLIINTTPLGMVPDITSAPAINYKLLTPAHYLYDLVYNPERTLFLQQGAQQGAIVKNGYDMLILQAEESWRIWNEQP